MTNEHPLDMYLHKIGTNRSQFAEDYDIPKSTLQNLITRDVDPKSYSFNLVSKLAQAGSIGVGEFQQAMEDFENGKGNEVVFYSNEDNEIRSFKFGEVYGLLENSTLRALTKEKEGTPDYERINDYRNYLQRNVVNFGAKPGMYLMNFIFRATRDFPEYQYRDLQDKVIDSIGVVSMNNVPLSKNWPDGWFSVSVLIHRMLNGAKREHAIAIKPGQTITINDLLDTQTAKHSGGVYTVAKK